MADELRRQILDLMKSVRGLRGVVIADRDGIPIFKVTDESVPETLVRPNFFANVSFALEQGAKLGYGRTNHIISIHDRHQLIHFNSNPLILTVIGDMNANTGMLLSMHSELAEVTDAVKAALNLGLVRS